MPRVGGPDGAAPARERRARAALADDDETAEREAALVAVCACVAMTPPAEWTNAREVAMAAWACGDACAKGRADSGPSTRSRALERRAAGFAAREASDVAWALAAARAAAAAAATDNATVADVAAFLDRLADPRGRYPTRRATLRDGALGLREDRRGGRLCGNQPRVHGRLHANRAAQLGAVDGVGAI